MISDITILMVLKFAGLAVGLASTVWGMVHKMSTEDDQGRKRLTPAGQVAVALAFGAFLVAASSQGFETLARQAADQKAATDRAASEQLRLAHELGNERMLRRSVVLQLLALSRGQRQAAEARAAQADQRLLALQTADELRSRTLALSQDVNRGSQRNLQQTRVALGQTLRVLDRIEDLQLTITWELPLGDDFPELAALVRSVNFEAGPDQAHGIMSIWRSGGTTGLMISQEFPAYPTMSRKPDVLMAINNASGGFGFFRGQVPPITRELLDDASLAADWQSRHTMDAFPPLVYVPATNTLTFNTRSSSVNPPVRNGRIASVDDLRRSHFVFAMGGGIALAPGDFETARRLMARLHPVDVILEVSGRTFHATQEQIRRLPGRSFTAELIETDQFGRPLQAPSTRRR